MKLPFTLINLIVAINGILPSMLLAEISKAKEKFSAVALGNLQQARITSQYSPMLMMTIFTTRPKIMAFSWPIHFHGPLKKRPCPAYILAPNQIPQNIR
ncbi:MAG: hypothetical protein HRT88_18985 [Lentisphaeraceae bacterium]|nr:hypothetical protein [Lentisphaeraceae bacterium]